MDAQGFLVQFSGGPAPEHLLAHLDRVDAAAAWAEENCPTWFGEGPPLHVFDCNGELPTYTRNGVADVPMRASEAPAVVADVAALVELQRSVGATWTIHLDEGWLPAARLP